MRLEWESNPRVNPLEKGSKYVNERVMSPESVPIPLNEIQHLHPDSPRIQIYHFHSGALPKNKCFT